VTRATVRLRPARLEDASALAALSSQLGYPVSPDTLVGRLERLLPRADQVVLVASQDRDAVIGWIHGSEQDLLETDRRCEILGLVVDRAHRRQGIGQLLVGAVEQWADARGLTEISVRSNVSRADSHPFYERLGYLRSKTQHVYRKRLSAIRAEIG
jgi:GNAT superfamily N-acetyltransferase